VTTGETDTAIIGGGAAGVAAARRLHDAGVDCLIVEARERLGGRAWTVTDPSGFALDLGCGWLHSADVNPWAAIAETQGHTIDKTPPPWQRPSLPVAFALDQQRDFIQAQQSFFARLNDSEGRPDRAAADYLDPHGRWNALINAVSTYISGAELDRLSAHDFARYEDSGVNWRVAEGYGATIAAHAAGVPLALNCAVQRIDHSGKATKIATTQGTITAEQVIVTLPTPHIAEESLFAPALPAKAEAAAGLPLGLADKLFLALDGAEEFEIESRLFGRTDSAATGVYHFRPFGRPMIECYFGGENARALEGEGPRGFADFALRELTGLLGSDFARRVKPILAHGWASDAFARGSYSFALPGEADGRAALAAPVDDRLFFAGEACSPNYFSTAHGAYLTGIATAEQVIAARAAR
jgi:monoamine oxidase